MSLRETLRVRDHSFSRQGKKNPNPNFLVRISSGGVGVFHVKGWGPKSSVCPSKPRENKLFGGISRGCPTKSLGSFCWKTPHAHKLLVLGKGVGVREFFSKGGGRGANQIFVGVGFFQQLKTNQWICKAAPEGALIVVF